jgi:hypothetical protein
MTDDGVATLARYVGMDRRRAMLALGAAGLASSLPEMSGAFAKESAGKKRKKKCTREKQSCLDQVATYCAPYGDSAAGCRERLTPCCATCDVVSGVVCAATANNKM